MPDQAANEYMPVVMLTAFAISFAALNLGVSWLLGKRGRPNAMKDSAFECGMIPLASARQRFSVRFYQVAMLFILFDIEIVFLYPWAVKYQELGGYGLGVMFVFLTVLLVGLWYVIAKGALEWSQTRRRPVPQRSAP